MVAKIKDTVQFPEIIVVNLAKNVYAILLMAAQNYRQIIGLYTASIFEDGRITTHADLRPRAAPFNERRISSAEFDPRSH